MRRAAAVLASLGLATVSLSASAGFTQPASEPASLSAHHPVAGKDTSTRLLLDTFLVIQNGEKVLHLFTATNSAEVKVKTKAKLAGKTYKFKPRTKRVRSSRIGLITVKLPARLQAKNVRRGQQVVLSFVTVAEDTDGQTVRIRDKLTIDGQR